MLLSQSKLCIQGDKHCGVKQVTDGETNILYRERRQRDEWAEDREKLIHILIHMTSLRANECSPRVAWIFGQYKKPFTDGGVVKECMSAVADALLEGK